MKNGNRLKWAILAAVFATVVTVVSVKLYIFQYLYARYQFGSEPAWKMSADGMIKGEPPAPGHAIASSDTGTTGFASENSRP